MRPAALAALLTAALATPDASRAADAEKVFVGYVFGAPSDIDFRLYTHLCHAFVTADGDGRLNPNRNVPDPKLIAAAHKAGVKTLVSLGGWGWDDQFRAIASRAESEDRYVKAVLGLVRDADYDGIDVDWEYPDTAEEVRGFEHLARRLRAGLDAIGKEKGRHLALTMAASSNPGTLRWLGTAFLVETMDWVNVMTYDYAGPWTDYAGHHSPLHASSKVRGRAPSAEATIDYLIREREVPPDRLALGIPLYGRAFSVREPYASTKGRPESRMGEWRYARLAPLIGHGWGRSWDDETKSPWLIREDRTSVIGYDDPESAAIKGRWAREKRLRGVFFWEVAGDRMPDGSNPVQKAAREGLFGAGSK